MSDTIARKFELFSVLQIRKQGGIRCMFSFLFEKGDHIIDQDIRYM
jgi:hypothetical protein